MYSLKSMNYLQKLNRQFNILFVTEYIINVRIYMTFKIRLPRLIDCMTSSFRHADRSSEETVMTYADAT